VSARRVQPSIVGDRLFCVRHSWLVGLVCLVAACGGSQAQRAVGPATTTSSVSAVAVRYRQCHHGDLDVQLGVPEGGMARSNRPIVFTNQSHTPCTMGGFPGVEFIDVQGRVVGPKASGLRIDAPLVTLRPGQSATATLVQFNVGLYRGCAYPSQTVATWELLVSAPGENAAFREPLRTNVCRSTDIPELRITPVGAAAP
jgi:hypothetical protein